MLEYYNNATSVNIELVVLSGGTTVTGRSPWVVIRDKENGFYFDFASRTFTGTTVSATAPMVSSLDGLYTVSWDVSGIDTGGSLLKNHYYTFEYHDGTSLATDDVVFRIPPLNTGDVKVSTVSSAPGGGSTIVQGVWNAKQKKKLFDELESIRNNTKKAIELIRELLGRKSLSKEDLKQVTQIRERDLSMYQELLKILDLKSEANEKAVLEKLQLYVQGEELAKAELIEKLDRLLEKKEVKKIIPINDDDDDD